MVEAVVRDAANPSLAPSKLVAGAERIAGLRLQVNEIRHQVRACFDNGASAVHTTSLMSELMDKFAVVVLTQHLDLLSPEQRASFENNTALVAVGGTGRAEMCPYSDVDLLFLYSPSVEAAYEPFASQVQRDFWDCGLKLGASVRTIAGSLQWACQEPQFATSLVDARRLWGSKGLVEQLQHRFRRTAKSRLKRLIADVVASRDKERQDYGASTQQLEPDLKRSMGGLRDLHLIRWIGFVKYDAAQFDSMRLHSAITMEESRRLIHAHEFLTGLRIELHLTAGKEQDVLTRDEQLRIAAKRGFEATAAQLPVERFMQEYFRHSSEVANIARRVVNRTRQSPWVNRLIGFVMAYRIDDIYYVGPEYIDIARRHRQSALSTLEGILRLFMIAARSNVEVAPHLLELIKGHAIQAPPQLSHEAAQSFLALMRTTGKLAILLRSLYETGVLEAVLPCWRHIRCLLQFNQYHHFTVDEHTLRTIEAVESFRQDQALGQAYREIHHKELLHLALLLHDAGKGYEEDHSEVGRRLAEETSNRLGLPDHQRDLVMFLVHRHLKMADLALRRDISDRELLVKFSYEVGSPDALRMLYVLTAADISAVGPNTWNHWKAELLTTLYDRTMLWLSGKSHMFDESTRLRQIAHEVVQVCLGIADGSVVGAVRRSNGSSIVHEHISEEGLSKQQHWTRLVNACPAHYLLETSPAQIAADIKVIHDRNPDDIHVEAQYEADTGTVEYRVITHESIGQGCFHKLAGVLSAKRMEILSAAICTTAEGMIIDTLRVNDADHIGEIPEFRKQEVTSAICRVLRGETDVATLLKSRGKFATKPRSGPVSDLPLRVVIDNETSDRYSVLDIFAHDRPGLLYEITRSIYELSLNVALAKIATHFDQVLDVFYVTDIQGQKIHDGERLRSIRQHLMSALQAFENSTEQTS